MASFGEGFGEGFDVEVVRPSVSVPRLVLKYYFKTDVPSRGTLLQPFTFSTICRGQLANLLVTEVPTVGSFEKPWSQKIRVQSELIQAFKESLKTAGLPLSSFKIHKSTEGILIKKLADTLGVLGDPISLMELYTWLTALEEFEGEDFESLLLYSTIKKISKMEVIS